MSTALHERRRGAAHAAPKSAPKTLPERMAIAAAFWLQAKAREQEAAAARLDAEHALVALMNEQRALPLEGTEHAEALSYKVTVSTKLTRTLDAERVAALDAEIPAEILRRVITYKPSLNLREYRYIEQNEPAFFAALAKAVTTKPAKPTIDVRFEPTEAA